MENDPLWKDRKFILAILILLLTALVLFRIFWSTPPFSTDLQSMAIGLVLGQAFQAILKFYYNSSSESEKKNETINTLVNGKE